MNTLTDLDAVGGGDIREQNSIQPAKTMSFHHLLVIKIFSLAPVILIP